VGKRGPEPRGMWQHQSPPQQGGGVRSHGTGGNAESHLGRGQGSEPWDAWYHWSSPQQGGETRSYRTCGSAGALLGREVRSWAAGHVAVCGPSSAVRQGLGLQDTWQRVGAYSTPCFDLKPVCIGTRSAGYRQCRLRTASVGPSRTSIDYVLTHTRFMWSHKLSSSSGHRVG
jgi:hypothetical protein